MEQQHTKDIPVVTNNTTAGRFEISVNGHLSKIPYIIRGNDIVLFRTEVAEELRGKGLAVKLVEYALSYAKENDLKILPFCPFIRKYIDDHPEWKTHVKRFQLKDLF